jgi:hypothetical protein
MAVGGELLAELLKIQLRAAGVGIVALNNV